MKKLFKILLIVVLIIAVAFGGFLGFLTITEYRPEAVEELSLRRSTGVAPLPANGLTVLAWNIGYAGLGRQQDFFMDGGKKSRPEDRGTVDTYLRGIGATLDQADADLVLLQEVDIDSSRTYGIDEAESLARGVSAFALNYSCPFVPVPFPPMGKVHSGLLTTSAYEITSAERVALPCPFSWPVSTVNLKRCLLVSHLPVEDRDGELVLVNLHLEAYDDGSGKIAQTKQLMEFLQKEYEKGNYVIAGGDFNQVFPGGLKAWPNAHPELWSPGILDADVLPKGFGYVYDLSVPTCRLLNQPYNPADTANTQYYTIDGFIVSPNVDVSAVKTMDLGFACSDHNPVQLTVSLKG